MRARRRWLRGLSLRRDCARHECAGSRPGARNNVGANVLQKRFTSSKMKKKTPPSCDAKAGFISEKRAGSLRTIRNIPQPFPRMHVSPDSARSRMPVACARGTNVQGEPGTVRVLTVEAQTSPERGATSRVFCYFHGWG
jgi:hypothetical protein